MKPLMTALIDTYNHEKYIEQAITSVLEQGLSPKELEILVVDDGSTDRTSEMIRKFAPRVKHLRKKNGGQASAFNAGFAEARGGVIAFLDGDDWWAKGKLEAVAEGLERNPEMAAVGHGYYEYQEATGETRECVPPRRRVAIEIATPEGRREALRSWPFLLMGALTVRRGLLEWVKRIPEEMVFMADTAIQVAAMAKGALLLDQALFYYRHHAENRYAVGDGASERLRRRYEMTELVYRGVYRMMVERGLPEDEISDLLSGVWIEARRLRLSRFGGSRLEAYRTEMEYLRTAHRGPTRSYRIFKRAVVGAATMLLPARSFYRLRDWYGRNELGRYRERLFPAGHEQGPVATRRNSKGE
jgi:glycosyltransferase involved in cell wall biosynthesis